MKNICYVPEGEEGWGIKYAKKESKNYLNGP